MRKYGFSFSWKRALGISAAKGRISRQIGIPLTRSGRQRKVGRMLGCCVAIAVAACIFAAVLALTVAGLSSLYARNWRLDDLGCRYDYNEGGYHCHRGLLAGKKFKHRQEAERGPQAIQRDKAGEHKTSPK